MGSMAHHIWQHHGSVMGYWVNHMSFFIFPWQAPHGMGQWASRPPRREICTDRTMDGDMAGFGRQFMEISANPGMNWGIPCRSIQHYTANVDKTIVINHPFENCLYHLVYLWWFGGRFIIVLPTLCPIYFQAKPGIAILLGARFLANLEPQAPKKRRAHSCEAMAKWMAQTWVPWVPWVPPKLCWFMLVCNETWWTLSYGVPWCSISAFPAFGNSTWPWQTITWPLE